MRDVNESVNRGEPAVGIDLGTTHSVLAYVDELGVPRTVANSEGDRLTASAVLFEGDNVVVGREALNAVATDADQVALRAKREFGSRIFPRPLGGRSYPPEAIQAWVLNKLRVDAARQIGRFHQAVITVPAYFDEARRRATQHAGYIAGLEVLEIINEPVAAALAYAWHVLRIAETGGAPTVPQVAVDPDDSVRYLVYDLGGGTFDVTILEQSGDRFEVLATDGDARLGGYDWDLRIVDAVATEFATHDGNDPRGEEISRGRLWRACEEAKRTLSLRSKVTIPCEHQGRVRGIELTRERFEQLTADLLDRTRFTLREAVAASGVAMDRIDVLLLVGGATRMPAVAAMLREATGLEPRLVGSPDEIVAHGAALRAEMILRQGRPRGPRFSIQNVNAHSLGVAGTDSLTRLPRNAILIPRNTRLPATARKVFRTQKDGQRSLLIRVVEGESPQPDECAQVGQCVVRNLPPDLPAQSPVDVTFHYGADGILEVQVKLPGREDPAASQLTFTMERPNGMDAQQLAAWRAHVANLE